MEIDSFRQHFADFGLGADFVSQRIRCSAKATRNGLRAPSVVAAGLDPAARARRRKKQTACKVAHISFHYCRFIAAADAHAIAGRPRRA
jgi:hypothetical protein